MAEKLRREQPTSSIASALNLDAVRAAINPAPPMSGGAVAAVPEPSRGSTSHVAPVTQAPRAIRPPPAFLPPTHEPRLVPAPEPTGERPNIIRQFQLTAATDGILKQAIAAYSSAVGFELHASEFIRAVLLALGGTIDLHAMEARSIGQFKRPKNEASQFHKRDELERAIARAFVVAMRRAPIPE